MERAKWVWLNLLWSADISSGLLHSITSALKIGAFSTNAVEGPKNVQFQNWSYKNPFPSFFLLLSKFQSWKCWYWWELGCIFCKSMHKPSPHFPERKINKIFVVWKMLQYSCTLQIPEYYAILRLCKQMGFCMSFYILFLWKTAFFCFFM